MRDFEITLPVKITASIYAPDRAEALKLFKLHIASLELNDGALINDFCKLIINNRSRLDSAAILVGDNEPDVDEV